MIEVEFGNLRQGSTAEHIISYEDVFQFLGQVFAPMEHLHDQLEHLVVGVTGEESLSRHKLNEDATNCPYINSMLVRS